MGAEIIFLVLAGVLALLVKLCISEEERSREIGDLGYSGGLLPGPSPWEHVTETGDLSLC